MECKGNGRLQMFSHEIGATVALKGLFREGQAHCKYCARPVLCVCSTTQDPNLYYLILLRGKALTQERTDSQISLTCQPAQDGSSWWY